MNIALAFAPLPRGLILARRLTAARKRRREVRRLKKSGFWGMKFGIAEESGIGTQKIMPPKRGDRFSYNGASGIVVEARAEYPPDDFPKSSIEVKINP